MATSPVAASYTTPRGTTRARSCYDHLAGEIAVTIADRMDERGHIGHLGEGGELTNDGVAFLRSIGVDVDTALTRVTRRRLFCRPCLDWSELICPLLIGPKSLLFWIEKETWNAIQEAQAGGNHWQAA